MTAAYRLKGLGWFVSGVIVALGFYLVSLQVATERKKLEAVDSAIIQAHGDIRALETEFSTRANLAQLERWNGDVLALTAPTPAQYVHSEAQLASMDFNGASGDAKVEMASLVIPTLPTIAPPPDARGDAGATAAAAVSTPAPTPPPAATPAPVRVASAQPVADRVAAAVHDAVPAARATVARRARDEAVAMLDRKLLSDATLGDLMSGARRETASLR